MQQSCQFKRYSVVAILILWLSACGSQPSQVQNANKSSKLNVPKNRQQNTTTSDLGIRSTELIAAFESDWGGNLKFDGPNDNGMFLGWGREDLPVVLAFHERSSMVDSMTLTCAADDSMSDKKVTDITQMSLKFLDFFDGDWPVEESAVWLATAVAKARSQDVETSVVSITRRGCEVQVQRDVKRGSYEIRIFPAVSSR